MAEFVQPGTLKYFLEQHGRVLGQVWHRINPAGISTELFVFPTSFLGEVVPYKTDVCYATVCWDGEWKVWLVDRFGPFDYDPEANQTPHKTLKSALRAARKFVGRHAGRPLYDWQVWIDSMLDPVDDLSRQGSWNPYGEQPWDPDSWDPYDPYTYSDGGEHLLS